jgi:HJR/Mrr/RecB family endonuclease
MPRRRRKKNLLSGIITAVLLLLLLAGWSAWSFWRSLTPDIRWLAAVLASAALVTGTGIVILLLYYRRKQRMLIWSRAMSRWQHSPRSANLYRSVRQLSPGDLERFAAHVYQNMGYRVAHTGRSGDHGVDVRLRNPAGEVEIVQCKQWNHQVGEPDVRNLVGTMVHERAVRAYLWAPGGFTPEARRWARGKGVILADEREIDRLVRAVFDE